MSVANRGLGAALGGLRVLAGLPIVERLHLRRPLHAAVFHATRASFATAAATSRTFRRAARQGGPARQRALNGPALFDLTPTDEQRMLQEALGAFATARLRPLARTADTACRIPADLDDEARMLGAATLGIPAAAGGVAEQRGAVTAVLAAEALAAGDMGLAVAILAPGAVATALSLWGDAAQQATYLPAFTGPEPPVAALCVMEPRVMFDPFALHTTATRAGDTFVLTGTKSMVPRVADAELFLVAATDPSHGPAVFLVESSTAGLSVVDEPAMGLRAAATGTLHLDGVHVGADAVLAAGPGAYRDLVQRGRLAWAAMAVGTGQAVLDYVIPYVRARQAFGEPIAHRQSVAFAVADIAVELDGMRLATYRGAALADHDQPFATAAALARTLAGEKGMQIGSAGVQLLGGHGYVKDHPVERFYRDLRAVALMEGALLA